MIGKKIKGFKFESTIGYYFNPVMNHYIGEIGEIDDESTNCYRIRFISSSFWYPKYLCLQHLVEEENSALLYSKFLSEKTNDSIVESIIEQFKERSNIGINKYGVTLDRTDLTRLEWLNHAQQEAMDMILYLEKLKTYEK